MCVWQDKNKILQLQIHAQPFYSRKKVTKLREKISCKPTNSQNLVGKPTLHLLEAARSLLCAPAGGELKPSPSDEGEAGQKRLSPHGSIHDPPRGSRDLPSLPVLPQCLRARTTGICFWWAQMRAGAFRLRSGGRLLTRGISSCGGSTGRWRQLHEDIRRKKSHVISLTCFQPICASADEGLSPQEAIQG